MPHWHDLVEPDDYCDFHPGLLGVSLPPGQDDTVFVPRLGTIRQCAECGCLVAGGPTRCGRCAEEVPIDAPPQRHEEIKVGSAVHIYNEMKGGAYLLVCGGHAYVLWDLQASKGESMKVDVREAREVISNTRVEKIVTPHMDWVVNEGAALVYQVPR